MDIRANSANGEAVPPLTLDLTERALKKAKTAADWLRGASWGGEEAASESADRSAACG